MNSYKASPVIAKGNTLTVSELSLTMLASGWLYQKDLTLNSSLASERFSRLPSQVLHIFAIERRNVPKYRTPSVFYACSTNLCNVHVIFISF